MQKFYQKFVSIDLDGSGEIDLDEFYDGNKSLERSPFADRVFSIMDVSC